MLELTEVKRLLGTGKEAPLTGEEMAKSLTLTVFPGVRSTPRCGRFVSEALRALEEAGAQVGPWEAVTVLRGGRRIVPEGVTVLVPGACEEGARLAMEQVASLHETTIVGIFDGPCPVSEAHSAQARLEACAAVAALHLVQVQLYVEDETWTLLSLNGGVATGRHDRLASDLKAILVPKLASRVVPPRLSGIQVEPGGLEVDHPAIRPFLEDFVTCGRIWGEDPFMSAHTTLASLPFRSPRHRRIATVFLDGRNGMSYGFFARQLPMHIPLALPLTEGPAGDSPSGKGSSSVVLTIGNRGYVCPVPEVWVLTTRSGCKKTAIDPQKDIVGMGLVDGRVIFRTPKGSDPSIDCKPSFDTLTILASALGNGLIASVFRAIGCQAPICDYLASKGMGITHWHGYPDEGSLPEGYIVHGGDNPSVPCSTPQSAIFALLGKLHAAGAALERGLPLRGDIHVEPHHGTNASCMLSLTETAKLFSRTGACPNGILHPPAGCRIYRRLAGK